jgi:hypothetical protein
MDQKPIYVLRGDVRIVTNKRANATVWIIPVGIVLAVLAFLIFVGIPRYGLQEEMRLVEVHEETPLPGTETLCAGNVTVEQTNPTPLADGMTYTLFAHGDGECAYKTSVRVLTWRRMFS